MARSFLGFSTRSYIGVPQLRPAKQIAPGAVVIPLSFQWLTYQQAFSPTVPANILVNVNLSLMGNVQSIDKIVSVYIDNLGCDVPVYVRFPDTGHCVVALPNSAGWYLVFTNGTLVQVAAMGLPQNDNVLTNILVSNIFMPPNSDLEFSQSATLYKASATIGRGTTIYNTNFGIPALGDQTTQVIYDLSLLTSTTVFGSPLAAGFFYYITNIHFNITNPQCNAGAAFIAAVTLESTGITGSLFTWHYMLVSAASAAPAGGTIPVFNVDGMQLKIKADETWRVRVTAANPTNGLALGVVTINFTTNPS